MKTSLCVVATALVASVNAKDPQNAGDCKVTYDQELWSLGASSASDANSICEALVRFSKCLGQFPPDKDMEYLMITQEKEDFCAKQFEAKEPPSVRTARESLLLTVDDTKKIEFHRHRRETIDVFQMNANVNTLTDTVALLAKKIDQMTGTLTDTVTEIDGKLEKSAQDTKDALDAATDTQGKALDGLRGDMGQLETKVDNSVSATNKQLDDVKTATDKQLDNAKTATDKQLADAKKESKANMDALAKKIGESVDTKLKPSSKVLASLATTYHSNPKIPVFRVGKWHTYSNRYGWLDGNRPSGYGGVHPSQWTDGNHRADQMTNDFKYLQRLFTRKATATSFGATICSEMYNQYSSTNGGDCGAILRIKNTGKSTIPWSLLVTISSWHVWDESASISLNGNNQIGNKNCPYECRFGTNLNIPANSAGNRVSTVVFISTSSEDSGRNSRATLLSFQDNSLSLPNNLEFVDDLDVQTGSWKK